MSSLSELGNAGRADLIPGFILSRPRTYMEGAEAEKLACAWYLDTLATAAKGLTTGLAETLLVSGKQDILDGKLRFKGYGYNRWALAPASLPWLILLSTRPKHANTVTQAMVAQWIVDFDADKIAEAVYELWGYAPRKATRWRPPEPDPIDWEAILKRLTAPAPEGMAWPIERAMELTDIQLAALLGGEPDPKKLFEEKMYGWFEMICDASGKQPDELEKMDDAELAKWIEMTAPKDRQGKQNAVVMVRQYLSRYVAACG